MNDFLELLEMYDIQPGPDDIEQLLEAVEHDNITGLIEDYNDGELTNEDLRRDMDVLDIDLDTLISLGLEYDEDN